jgi:hypothetical protein
VGVALDDINATLRIMLNSLTNLVLAQNPSNGQLRISVDAGTLPTVTTVTGVTTVTTVSTVTTVGSVTNTAQVGGFAANGYIQDTMNLVWASAFRPRIT